jgi:hypothetical protein
MESERIPGGLAAGSLQSSVLDRSFQLIIQFRYLAASNKAIVLNLLSYSNMNA